ncbi:MAG: PorP/SprF family type IX secretion system membrane protein [Bacteroidia bacterium]
MRKTGLHIFFLFIVCSLQAQQDPQYSQYMFNQVIINPAYIGSKDALNATGLFRKEWVGISGSPQTNNLSISGPLKSKMIGLGGHITQETIGPKKWVSAYADYCYRVKLANGKLSFGLSTGLVSYNFNTAKLDLYDQNEPVLYSGSINHAVRFDMSAGAYYFSRTFYVGLSVTHLTNPKLFDVSADQNKAAFYDLNQHMFLTIGKGFQLSDQLVFSPSLMVKTIRGRDFSVDVNANFLIKNKLWLGVSCRTSLAVVGIAQYLITDRLKIGYSYDYGLRGIVRASSGSHEVMLSYDLKTGKSKIVTSRFL